MRYIPDFISSRVSEGDLEGSFEGVVLVLSIQNFSIISPWVLSHGKDALPGISATINKLAEITIEAVTEHGGIIALRVSDCAYIIFPGSNYSAAFRAINQIQKGIDELDSITIPSGEFRLGLCKQVSFGRIDWKVFCLRHQYEFLFGGEAFEELARYCREKDGDLCAPSIKRLINSDSCFENGRILSSLIKESPVEKPLYPFKKEIRDRFIHPRYRFLKVQNEFRHLIVCCVAIESPNLHCMELPLLLIHELVDQYGGFFHKIDNTSAVPFVTIVFGAPTSDGKTLFQACEFALALQSRLSSSRISLSSGTCFTGFAGWGETKEFRVLGKPREVSARLLSISGKGEIICDEHMQRESKYHYLFSPKSEAILDGTTWYYYSLLGRKAHQLNLFDTSFVGRDDELNLIKEVVERVLLQQGRGIVYIHGDPGQGKTRLAYEALSDPLYPQPIILRCPIHSKPLEPIRDLISQWFFPQEQAQKESFATLYREQTDTDVGMSILGSLIHLYWEDSEWNSIPANQRETRQIAAFADFFGKALSGRALLLILDDAQWLDERSHAFLLALANESARNIAFLAPCRYQGGGKTVDLALEGFEKHDLHLPLLSVREQERIIFKLLGSREVPQSSLDYLTRSAAGNPFFLEQIVSNMLEEDAISQDGKIKDMTSSSIAFSINDVINSRIDRFSSSMQECLFAASVLGLSFDPRIVKRMLLGDLSSYIEAALRHQIIKTVSDTEYSFSHAIMRDSIYNRLTPSKRNELHKAAAKAILALHPKDKGKYGREISYHYEQAGKKVRAIYYLIAHTRYLLPLSYYHECLQALGKALRLSSKIMSNKDSRYTQILFWIGLHHHYLLNYSKAELVYRHVLKQRIQDLGEGHPKLSEYINNLGRLYKDTERFEEAEKMLRQSLRMEHLNHCRSTNVADRANNIASLLAKKGEYRKALAYSFFALKLFAQSDHPERSELVALMEHNIGNLYLNLGDLAKAETYLQSSMDARKELYREESPEIASLYLGLGKIAHQRGETEKAEMLQQRSIRLFYRVFRSGSNPQHAAALTLRGDIYRLKGENAKARKIWRAADKMLSETFSEEHLSRKELREKLESLA